MMRLVVLGASFVALPVEGSQRGGAFEFEIALAKVPLLDDKVQPQHGRLHAVEILHDRIHFQMFPLRLRRATHRERETHTQTDR